MSDIIKALLAFVLTGVIGNSLIQRWQFRAWLQQQQFLGHEKEYIVLKDLSTELSRVMGARHYQMRRVISATHSLPIDEIELRVSEYTVTLKQWNEEINSYYVRLTLYIDYERALSLERKIHKPFVSIGSKIERALRLRRKGQPVPETEYATITRELDNLQAAIFRTNRDLLRDVEDIRRRVYYGENIPYSTRFLKYFSTIELIKALFIRDVDRHTIVRSSPNPKRPRSIST
jgi:hypothetical protein